jgi:hypothetical protein
VTDITSPQPVANLPSGRDSHVDAWAGNGASMKMVNIRLTPRESLVCLRMSIALTGAKPDRQERRL